MKRAPRPAAPLLAAALAAAALTVPIAPACAGGLTYVTSFGSLGSGPGQFKDPFGVAVTGGLVYVADEANNRIDVFDPAHFAASFTSFGSFGSGPGQFNAPEGVAVDGSGNVFVADSGNNRIVELATVPEPSSLALVAAGGLVMLIAWRIRRQAGRAG
jgi:DNA-binding beta-propeller fold protein YncE